MDNANDEIDMEVVEPEDAESDMESGSDNEEDADGETPKEPKQVYLPGQQLAEDEELVCDESAYVMRQQKQKKAKAELFR